MATYNITVEKDDNEDTILRLSFGDQAENDQIIRDVKKLLGSLKLDGGRLIKLEYMTLNSISM